MPQTVFAVLCRVWMFVSARVARVTGMRSNVEKRTTMSIWGSEMKTGVYGKWGMKAWWKTISTGA